MTDALILWVLALPAFALFGLKTAQYVRTLLGARPEKRGDQPGKRLRMVATYVFGCRRLLEEPVIGVAHLLFFWAFLFYASSFFWNLVRGMLPFLPVPFTDEIGWMRAVLMAFGVLGLAALGVAAVRRYFFTPPRLERSGDATLILVLIAIVLATSVAGLWFRASAPGFARAMWWTHMVTVLGFLAYLPYSKHLHLLAAPFGVFFGSLQAGSVRASSAGASRREEFTWRQLLSGLACAECGRCDRACPAYQAGFPLSPKMLMHHMKELVRGGNGAAFVGETIKAEEIWACTTCLACMRRCPVLNEHVPLLLEMRRYLVGEGQMDKPLQDALRNLTRYGNSFGAPPRARAKWVQQAGFAIKDARKEPAERLWFVGDYASYDPRLAAATCATARVFQRAHLDFGILYDAERNSGNDARLAGEEGLFETLRDQNLKAFAKAQFSEIITTDPHTLHVLRHEYSNGHGPLRVRHHSEVFSDLVVSGSLRLNERLGIRVTYHDPCYLGRYNGIFDAPRRVIEALGAELVEMPRNRTYAQCCGAGGGRIWMEDPPGVTERPSVNRVREAAALPGVRTLVVACPKDLVMFQDAIKTAGLEERLEVKELAELVEQAMG